jgi:hypothetical protein
MSDENGTAGRVHAAETDGSELDGNTLAGPLGELFAVDLTVASSRCAGCGRVDTMAQLVVYGPDPGWVARCPGCASVVLRLVRTPDAAWLDLHGAASIRIPLAT